MILKPQDIVILLKVIVRKELDGSYRALSHELYMSALEVHAGVKRANAAEPLSQIIVQPDEPPPVWPDPEGQVRGIAFSPLYRTVPAAC